MSAVPQTSTSFIKYIFKLVLVFVYFERLLWSTMLRPGIDIDVRWVPKSFFASARQTTCIIRIQYAPMAVMESTFFATLAMFGYFCGCGGVAVTSRTIYGKTLARFEQAMMGVLQKFYWMCLVPWIITFAHNWLNNVGEFLLLLSGRDVYEAHNMYAVILLFLAYFVVQALLASEVLYMALHGWCAMKNINDENPEWEKRKRHFNGDTLDTVFGMAN